MSLAKVLRYLTITGVFLVLLTPLIVTDSLFFPFITGKAFFFRIMVEVILVAWLILAWLEPRWRPQRSVILLTLLALVLVTSIATFLGVNPVRSFWSNFERMEGLITFWHLLGYFLVLSSVLKTEKLWTWLFRVSIAVSVVMAGYGLLQLSGKVGITQGSIRLDATLGNSIYLAVYMLIHIFLAAWLAVKYWNLKWWRVLLILVIGLQLVILYYTATRGAILGLIGGVLLTALLIAWRERENRLVRKSALGLLAAVLILVGFFWLSRESNFVKQSSVLSRFANISFNDDTTSARLTIWQMALSGFKERPILGWGPDNFMVVFNKYYQPTLWNQEPWFDRSHNIFLDWLISAGLFGLIAYLTLFISALYYLWRRSSVFTVIEASLFSGLFAAYFFHNMFVFDNLVSYILFLIILAYLHHHSLDSVSALNLKSQPVSQPAVISVTVLGLMLLSLAVYFVNWQPILAAKTSVKGLQTAEPNQRITLLKQALDYHTLGDSEIREQILSNISEVSTSSDLANTDKERLINLALTEMAKQVELMPNDARSRLFYGSILLNLGRNQEAIIQLERARALSPKKQLILMQLALAYYKNDEIERSLELNKLAYSLDKSYPQARKNYINFLVTLKKYEPLPSLWREEVLSNPTDMNDWASWAATEFKLGHRDKSIEILEQMADKFPDARKDVEGLIREIKAGGNPLK